MAFEAGYQERGVLRSGRRFAARNIPYYLSEAELLSHHKKLLEDVSGPTYKPFYIGRGKGSLMQATIRFNVKCPTIKHELTNMFLNLFREHSMSSTEGFEVVVTFNAIVTNAAGTTFSIFYGHDFRANSLLAGGASPELKYGETILVRNLDDLRKIPTSFDFDTLARDHRFSFQSSDVRVAEFINIIYLVYRFIDGGRSRTRKGRQ